MAGELERYEDPGAQELAEAEEFWSQPAGIRRAALEYARGMRLDQDRSELPSDSEVKFILVGVEQGGRSILFASSQVTETRFARQFDGIDVVPITADPKGPVARVPRMTAIVGAKMTSFEQHVGMDYADALATMLAEWRRRRQAAERRALEQGRNGLGLGL